MKNFNFLKAVVLVVLFSSFTATSFSGPAKTDAPVKQKTVLNSNFDMYLSNTSVDLVVNYLNPQGQQLIVKVYNIFGQLLETNIVSNIEGKVNFNLETLELKGGTGTYTVSMTDGDGTSPKKGTIVIIKE